MSSFSSKGLATAVVVAALCGAAGSRPAEQTGALRARLATQTQSQANAKSEGCLHCHAGIEPMHASPSVRLGCTDCHGGDATTREKNKAHVQPRFPGLWRTSANPVRSYTALLDESAEFVKFMNPGDLRVARETCGGCHLTQSAAVPRSTMT